MFSFYLWGIETKNGMLWTKKKQTFSFYLWGIETKYYRSKSRQSLKVFILPMRNWNSYILSNAGTGTDKFSFYLWGIETTSNGSINPCVCVVFILPMRNWNPVEVLVPVTPEPSFHSTYEELKPPQARLKYGTISMFSFYLWGIETKAWLVAVLRDIYRFHSTYEELKLNPCVCIIFICTAVFILPMRNWNSILPLPSAIGIPVFILPMRNWNECKIEAKSLFNLRFHSTYEELKPLSPKNGCLLSGVFILPMRNWNT